MPGTKNYQANSNHKKKISGAKKGGAIGNTTDNIYVNFLRQFDATPNMTSQEVQQKFKEKIMSEFETTSQNGKVTPQSIDVIQNNLQKYVKMMTNVQNSLQKNRNALKIQQSNINQEQAINKKFQSLVKETNALLREFDKFLLKHMSFVRINPKKDQLLNDLAQRMKNIADKYKLQVGTNANLGSENYSQNTLVKTTTIQNKIMIDVIQALIENTRPIYKELMNNAKTISTNVPRNTTRKILESIEKERMLGTQLQKDFSENISNWVKLLTEVIELNAMNITSSSLSRKAAINKLGDFHLEYQDSQNNINQLLTDYSVGSPVKNIFSSKMKNEVFVQELVSEMFRWGMSSFKIFKYNQMMEQPSNGNVVGANK